MVEKTEKELKRLEYLRNWKKKKRERDKLELKIDRTSIKSKTLLDKKAKANEKAREKYKNMDEKKKADRIEYIKKWKEENKEHVKEQKRIAYKNKKFFAKFNK